MEMVVTQLSITVLPVIYLLRQEHVCYILFDLQNV